MYHITHNANLPSGIAMSLAPMSIAFISISIIYIYISSATVHCPSDNHSHSPSSDTNSLLYRTLPKSYSTNTLIFKRFFVRGDRWSNHINTFKIQNLISGVTILLSLTVFLNLVAEKIPTTSDAVPLIGTNRSCVSLGIQQTYVWSPPVLESTLYTDSHVDTWRVCHPSTATHVPRYLLSPAQFDRMTSLLPSSVMCVCICLCIRTVFTISACTKDIVTYLLQLTNYNVLTDFIL